MGLPPPSTKILIHAQGLVGSGQWELRSFVGEEAEKNPCFLAGPKGVLNVHVHVEFSPLNRGRNIIQEGLDPPKREKRKKYKNKNQQ